MKALGCQPVESASLFKVLVSDVFNLHPYTALGPLQPNSIFTMDAADAADALPPGPGVRRMLKLSDGGAKKGLVRDNWAD